MMWMEFQCGTRFVAGQPLTRQHFSLFVDSCPMGLSDAASFGKLFFQFFTVSVLPRNPMLQREDSSRNEMS